MLALACKPVDPAPQELDELFPYLWNGHEELPDERLQEALANLSEQVGGDTLAENLDGALSLLSSEDLAVVGMQDHDPSEAYGVYLIRPIACSFEELEEQVWALDQAALHEDSNSYDSYHREHTSDLDAYTAGEASFLTWETTYGATILGASYTATVLASMRRVPASDTSGRLLTVQAWFPEPASFEDGSSKTFELDFQSESYLERPDGTMLHAYAIWRDVDFGGGVTMEDEGVQRLVLNALSDWDDDTEANCL